MKLNDIKPVSPALVDYEQPFALMPVCVTLHDFNMFMAVMRSGHATAKAWADLQTWCWRNPQNFLNN